MSNGNYPPRYVRPPDYDTELVVLRKSLQQLSQVGSDPSIRVQVTTTEGLKTVTTKNEANKVGRAILKEWSGLFPELKDLARPNSRRRARS